MERHFHYRENDIIYMRWKDQNKKVVRVAKIRGVCVALYPTRDRSEFSFETFKEIDDPGMKFNGVKRNEIKDEVWLRLLDGEDIRNILRGYQPSPLGEEQDGDNRFSYYYAGAGTEQSDVDYHKHEMFHIVDDLLEQDRGS